MSLPFKATGSLASAAAIANMGFIAGNALGEGDKPIRIGLIGCGGRGTGAVGDLLSGSDNVVVTVLGDIDQAPLNSAYNSLKGWEAKGKFAVKPENKFVGYDAIQKVCSHPEVDLVVQTTPPGLRYLTLRTAVDNGKHSFVEKPVCVDAYTYSHVLESGKIAEKKGLAVACGLQRRSSYAYRELIKQIDEGAIGEIIGAESYWNGSVPWVTKGYGVRKDWTQDDMDYQLRNWLSFGWLSGDSITEQSVHCLDIVLWALKNHPTKANGSGIHQEPLRSGVGDNFDTFAVDYTVKNPQGNEIQIAHYSRQFGGGDNKVEQRIVGTKGYAVCEGHMIFKHGENKPFWRYTGPGNNGYQTEHTENIAAIRAGKPINSTVLVAESSFATVMGRESCYSGQFLKWDKLVDSKFRIGTDKLASGKAELPVKGFRVPGQYRVAGYVK